MNKPTDQLSGVLPAARIVSGEVVPAGEQTAAVVYLSGSELAHLLERAARPVVLQGPQTTPARYATPSAGGPGHPGITVNIPYAGAGGYALPAVAGKLPDVPTTRTWAPMGVIVSAAAFLGGPLAELLGNSFPAAVILCAVGFAGGVRSLVVLLRQQQG